MKVQELIDKLNEFPPDMKVLAPGYEAGAEDITFVDIVRAKRNHDNSWWDGDYDLVRAWQGEDEFGYENYVYIKGKHG